MKEETYKIDTAFIKLDSLLKLANIAESGGHAKHLIKNEFVLLNNQVILLRGKKIYPGDIVTVLEQNVNIRVEKN
ncbi:MAG: RNA-binding S4 domain-containing protein [Pseudomonadota bacterium]